AKNFLYNRGSNLGVVKFDMPKSLYRFINKIKYFNSTLPRATILKIVEQKTLGNPYELSAS
ncbi:hypothetical protein V7092_19420, partial [Bacillus wiedmannii]